MRLGKPDRKRRGEVKKTAGDKTKPKHCSAGSVVGELSPDLVAVHFRPEILRLARESMEKYAADLLEYEDQLRLYQQQQQQQQQSNDAQAQARIGTDGNVTVDGPDNSERLAPPAPPPKPVVHSQVWLDELEEMLSETTEHFQGKQGGWKVHARAARFERMLDEKYGVFRPFITNHPQIEQFLRSVQRKYASGYFSPFRQSKPPIPRSTAVVILFMMYRGKVKWEILVLSVLFFLVGLQPWALVVLVAGWHGILESRRKKPLSSMKSFVPLTKPYYSAKHTAAATTINDDITVNDKTKHDTLCKPVGTPVDEIGLIDATNFDTIVLGSGPSPLFTAALLSRAGRKVLVLSPRNDASGCFTVSGGNETVMRRFEGVPFDVESSNMSKISKLQTLLAPALCSETDYQGGVRFAKVGMPSDGYTFDILSVPGMGTDGKSKTEVPFAVRSDGIKSLMEDAAQYLGDGWPDIHGGIGQSTVGAYVTAMKGINDASSQFFLSKLLADNVNDMRGNSTYHDTAIRYAAPFLDKCFPANAHARSLMAAIGMKGENIKPSMTSMGAHVTNVAAAVSGEGMHYPVGGPRALCHALATVIEQMGGKVVTEASVMQLLFEVDDAANPPASTTNAAGTDDDGIVPPRCVGVQLQNQNIKFDMSQYKKSKIQPVIISTHSLVTTFIRFLPDQIRTKYKVPRGLPALAERRPVFKILFALDGSAEDLNVTGADYYRLPGAALAHDTVDENGVLRLGEIGWSSDSSDPNEVTVANVNKEEKQNDANVGDKKASNIPEGSTDAQIDTGSLSSTARSKADKADATSASAAASTAKPKRRRNKFDTGVSYLQISFPSAKDPSFEARHGKVTTCVVTIEADDDFVTPYDTKPRLFAIQKNKPDATGDYQRLMERVKKDLLNIYPQLAGKVMHAQLIGPLHRGLSHTPERYAAKGVRPDTPYPGLYVGGSDLTIGESVAGALVGGWLAANAVVGYGTVDYLYRNKNISTDLQEFMDTPTVPDTEDVAVPYTPKVRAVEKEQTDESAAATPVATASVIPVTGETKSE